MLIASFGFSQTNLEDFEGTVDFTGANNLGAANVVADPLDGSNTVGEIISSAAGDPWQQADLVMQSNFMDLSTNITVQVDVYSTTSFTMMARVDDTANNTATTATAAVDYVAGGWQTMTFTFNESLDGQGVADGQYNKIAFFPNWAGGGNGTNGDNPDWNNPLDFTLYIDNITAIQGDEISGAPVPDGPAPLPTNPDGETFSIYDGNLDGDVTTYSMNWPFAYQFGDALIDEVDLDPGADVNGAWQFNFGSGGYGQGEGPVDASTYGFVSFDYWAEAALPNGFRVVMISNDGGVTEHNYEIGTQEPLVTEAWTKVVIPMSYFTNLGFADTAFFQWKFDPFAQSVDNAGTVYIDNFLLTVSEPLSVNNFDIAEFNVSPNPSNSEWNIKSTVNINTVEVYNILGKRVMSITPSTNDFIIDGSSLVDGIYFAKMSSEGGDKTMKLIKN